MNTDNLSEIKIDPLLSRLVQPYSERDLMRFLDSLALAHEDPVIHTWKGYHLADQYIYQVCVEYRIPYTITELSFEDWTQAALYVCSNQLSREGITPEYRKYLIGQKFQFTFMGSEEVKQVDSKYSIAAALSHELYMSAGTVMKYHVYSMALNDVFDQSVDFATRILLGKTRISHENAMELSRLMPEEIKAIAATVITDNIDHITLSFIRNEVKWSHIQTRAPQSRREQKEQKEIKHAAIRQMPQYDPDAEVNSLCMTIDSWISSIQRVQCSSNFKKITNKASLHLMKKLSFLEHTINAIQESLVERNNL